MSIRGKYYCRATWLAPFLWAYPLSSGRTVNPRVFIMTSFVIFPSVDDLGMILCYRIAIDERTYADVRGVTPLPREVLDKAWVAHQDHGRDCAK